MKIGGSSRRYNFLSCQEKSSHQFQSVTKCHDFTSLICQSLLKFSPVGAGINTYRRISNELTPVRRKHNVEPLECEEAFFDEDKVVLRDVLHSNKEERYILLGKTTKKRLLFIVFTVGAI